jgi:hypothetical protein
MSPVLSVFVRAERHEDGAGLVQPRGDVPNQPTLNASVRRRRTDRAFYIRLAGAIRQNERALERLNR